MDKSHLKDLWWEMTLRGIVALLFGAAAIFWPHLTLATLVLLFSIFILISGILELLSGLTSMGKGTRWYLRVVIGILELGVGVYLVRHQAVAFNTFILLVGFILILRGVIEAVASLLDESLTVAQKTINFIMGLVAFVVGIVILQEPQKNGVAFVWVLGIFAFVTGILDIAMAVDIKHITEGKK